MELRGGDRPGELGELSPSYRTAAVGRRQSPIDLASRAAEAMPLPPLEFDYRAENIVDLNDGHTIAHGSEGSGSTLHVGDRINRLAQFHMHVPSEHTLDGRHADMEIHFVHRSGHGEVCVVAVLADAGTHDLAHVPVYELPTHAGELIVADAEQFNPIDYLPKDRSYFAYEGSFTTPPCNEGVRWIVMRTPIAVPVELIDQYREALGRNNRPVQPTNGRRILRASAG